MKLGCQNKEYPDKYGHYREAKYCQTKNHWFWKVWVSLVLMFTLENLLSNGRVRFRLLVRTAAVVKYRRVTTSGTVLCGISCDNITSSNGNNSLVVSCSLDVECSETASKFWGIFITFGFFLLTVIVIGPGCQ